MREEGRERRSVVVAKVMAPVMGRQTPRLLVSPPARLHICQQVDGRYGIRFAQPASQNLGFDIRSKGQSRYSCRQLFQALRYSYDQYGLYVPDPEQHA